MTTVAEAVVEVRGDGSRLRRDVQRSTRSLGGVGRTAGLAFAGGFAAFGIAKVVKDSVNLEKVYSTTMRQIAVATGAPAKAVQRLDDLALKMGADTVFSANEAAAAELNLAKGGLSVADIRAGALANSLTLATAGQLDLATAAQTTVRGMGAFNLTGKESERVTTALAGAANASTADVGDLAQSLSQAGGVANSAGLSIEETTGFLGLFADNAQIGSDAGTTLRTMLLRLVPQTKKAKDAMRDLDLKFTDANGNFVSGVQIASRLQKAFKGLNDQERTTALTTIFGQDAIRGANALITDGAGTLRKYIRASKDRDQAEELAQAAMGGTQGALERLRGNIETAELSLGRGLAPAVEDVADKFGDWLGKRDLESDIKGLTSGIGDLWGVVSPFVGVAGDLLGVFDDLPGPVKTLAIEVGLGAVAVSKMRTAMAGSWLSSFSSNVQTSEGRVKALGGIARNVAGIGGFLALSQGIKETDDHLATLETAAGGALTGFAIGGVPGAAVGAVAGAVVGLAHALRDSGDAADEAAPKISDYTSSLDPLTARATKATRGIVAETLRDSGADKLAEQYGLDPKKLVDAVLGSPKDYQRQGRQINGILDTLAHNRSSITGSQAYENAKLDYQSGGNPALGISKDEADATWKAYQDQIDLIDERTAALKKLKDAIADNREQMKKDRKEAEFDRRAEGKGLVNLRKYHDAIRNLPKEARTTIRQLGMDPSIDKISRLSKKYELTKPEVQTLVTALGLEEAYNTAGNYKARLDNLDGTTANTTVVTDYKLTGYSEGRDPYREWGGNPSGGGGAARDAQRGHGGKGGGGQQIGKSGRGGGRIVLDLGEGRRFSGMLRDEVDASADYGRTLERMRR